MSISKAYNQRTYGDYETFRIFTEALARGETEDSALRHVWVGKNHRMRIVGRDALYSVCGTHCANPACGNKLDYSLGNNIKNGKKASENMPSLDHKIPTTRGGKDVVENYQVLCNRCNTLKNDAYGADDARRLRGLADMVDAFAQLVND
jgi:HNH endonuclease